MGSHIMKPNCLIATSELDLVKLIKIATNTFRSQIQLAFLKQATISPKIDMTLDLKIDKTRLFLAEYQN